MLLLMFAYFSYERTGRYHRFANKIRFGRLVCLHFTCSAPLLLVLHIFAYSFICEDRALSSLREKNGFGDFSAYILRVRLRCCWCCLFWVIFPYERTGRFHRWAKTNPVSVTFLYKIYVFGDLFTVVAYFSSKNSYLHYLQRSSGLGNSTLWTGSSRRFRCTHSRQKRPYVASVREKS